MDVCFASSDDFSDEQVSARIRKLADQQTRLTSLDVVNHLKISLILAQEFLRVGAHEGVGRDWDMWWFLFVQGRGAPLAVLSTITPPTPTPLDTRVYITSRLVLVL